MAAPLINKDTFWADVVNSLFMRSLYRLPKPLSIQNLAVEEESSPSFNANTSQLLGKPTSDQSTDSSFKTTLDSYSEALEIFVSSSWSASAAYPKQNHLLWLQTPGDLTDEFSHRKTLQNLKIGDDFYNVFANTMATKGKISPFLAAVTKPVSNPKRLLEIEFPPDIPEEQVLLVAHLQTYRKLVNNGVAPEVFGRLTEQTERALTQLRDQTGAGTRQKH
ncbi:hypothetical protein FQ377_14160 [Arthrobacter echini]|uniref:Uncharacterized protein n=1 Tax=Arthrobacter echini TaxID=1529066 RepID=A0A5D0XIP3_9MICC|nr:hypothetical protein [Arthrobacter echini]TYC96327.1 hypothetical protein FQ377_14160 [Arthrobacter echini]